MGTPESEKRAYIKQFAEENEVGAIVARLAVIFNDLTKTSHLLGHPGVRYVPSDRGLATFHWFAVAVGEEELD